MNVQLTNRLEGCENKPSKFLTIPLVTASAVPISATDLLVTSVTFYGFKTVSATAAPTANGADTLLGYKDADGVLVAANSPVFLDTIAAGSSVTERAPLGTKYNLKDFSVLGTTGDKIIVGYEA